MQLTNQLVEFQLAIATDQRKQTQSRPAYLLDSAADIPLEMRILDN